MWCKVEKKISDLCIELNITGNRPLADLGRLHYKKLKYAKTRLMPLSTLFQLPLAHTADICDVTQPSQETHRVDEERQR